MWKWLYGPILAAKADRLGTYAAALAYCIVLSLIPFLIVTFTIETELTHQDLVKAYSDLLVDILPAQSIDVSQVQASKAETADAELQAKRERVERVAQMISALQESSHPGLATVGFLLAVYTSFNLMTQVVRTLLFIFDDPRKAPDWNLHVVFKTIYLFMIWMLLLLLLAACSAVSPRAVLAQLHLNPTFWRVPLIITRDLVGLASLFCAFFLTYALVPSKRYKLSQVRNGSFVAACGWMLCSMLFALLNIWRTNAVYEVLGSVVIILLWAQACAWSLIIGACWIVRFPSRRR